jgi:heme/copper-type cytochrome/quinol oxidase subunit 2
VASFALTLMSLFAAAAEEEERPSAAEEGKKVITAMLIVGLIFLGVILIGQALNWLSHRRDARRPPAY